MNSYPKNLQELKQLISEGQKFEYLFFYGTCLSNWCPASFVIDEIEYYNSEQYMMAEKARTFGDMKMLEKILQEDDPRKVKAMGRDVANYKEAVWAECRFEKVYAGVLAKFRQNPTMKKYLLCTGNKILVEASPVDAIWGIKRGEQEHGLTNVESWRGLNLLGFLLMKVRDQLEKDENYSDVIFPRLKGVMKC